LSLGTHATRRAAEAAYARSVTDQADGKAATPSAVTTPTLGDYASSWVDTRLTKRGEPLRPRVKDLYVMELRLHVVPTFGSTRLARITTAQVRDWNARLRGPDGPGASTAAKCYRLLRSILTTAVADGLIPANPCTLTGAGIEPADERPIPTVAQVHDLVEHLPGADAMRRSPRCLRRPPPRRDPRAAARRRRPRPTRDRDRPPAPARSTRQPPRRTT